jgi:hypothetical protein
MSWILVIFVHAGMLSNKDSMAITNVPGFKTEASCLAAGNKAKELTRATTKSTAFVCVKQD